MKTTTVSFPGLGLEEWTMNKVAFTLFDRVEVRWYGILMTSAILFAFFYLLWRSRRNEKIPSDDLLDITIFAVIAGVIGARAYYVLTEPDQFESFYDVIAIWNGGIALYGSLIGGFIGLWITCRIKKVKWQKVCDMAVPGIMFAQALGRWGNFINGEAHGYRILGGESKYYFFSQEFRLSCPDGGFFDTFKMGLTKYGAHAYYHPTFLYESVWNLVGFVLINIFYRHKKFDGQVTLAYLAWYGFGRMFIEGLRTDSLFIPGTELRISQMVGLTCFVLGALFFIILGIINRKHDPFSVPAYEAPAPLLVEPEAPIFTKSDDTHWGQAIVKTLSKHRNASKEDSDRGNEN